MHKSTVAIDTVPLPERPIRVRIPAKAAFDLEAFQKVLVNLADRLGCTRCLSGADCLFTIERDLVVNPADLSVKGIGEVFGGR